jgi:MtN3 and saliva related transmembrane protein
MPSMVTILGLIAAACTTLCYVPQVKKAWQSGSTGDLSFKMLSLLAVGVALWLAYGILKGDLAVIAANAATLALVGFLAVLKFREKQREKAAG